MFACHPGDSSARYYEIPVADYEIIMRKQFQAIVYGLSHQHSVERVAVYPRGFSECFMDISSIETGL